MVSAFETPPSVDFLGIFTDSNLHGMYTILFVFATYMLLFKRPKTMPNLAMLLLTVVMYAFATVHDGLGLQRNLTAFLARYNRATDGRQFVSDPGFPLINSQIFLEGYNCVLWNALIAWRVWVIWDRSWRACAIPLCLLFGTAVSATGLGHQLSVKNPGTPIFGLDEGIKSWGITFLLLTFWTNVACTFLIVLRAGNHRRQFWHILDNRSVGQRYNGIILILIESGAFNCCTWIVLFVLLSLIPSSIFVVLRMLPQLTGIYATLVVVLVCLRATHQHEIAKLRPRCGTTKVVLYSWPQGTSGTR